ncbi:unnamed protein product [Cuscuta campestris]|uniref:Uncharacterized protein n=1 Tax=Cuscuta campestris TaxID=132261 RepID=A0A484NAU6_9ASTE|nr:unnamed protein product [Cuscuta campestris]
MPASSSPYRRTEEVNSAGETLLCSEEKGLLMFGHYSHIPLPDYVVPSTDNWLDRASSVKVEGNSSLSSDEADPPQEFHSPRVSFSLDDDAPPGSPAHPITLAPLHPAVLSCTENCRDRAPRLRFKSGSF